jgi:hypothetical protein
MKKETKKLKNRDNEKGAAMVTVLLISFLLLTASAGLLLESSMNTANVTDATGEMQAYNAAESGIQSAINVLRGNVAPNPLLDPNNSASHPNNRIDYRKAITLSSSNLPTDNSGSPRLSRWQLNYDTPSSDRVALSSGTYNPLTGFAYSVMLSDPDDTGSIITYGTEGAFLDPSDAQWKSQITIGSNGNLANISYTPYSANLNVSGGSANTNFGYFRITHLSGGDVELGQDLRFRIAVRMTKPYQHTVVLAGWIKKGIYTSSSSIKFDFDSGVYLISGSTITLTSDPLDVKIGGITYINASMTQAEPRRLVISSIGYGPRGAKKQLEATIRKNYFDGLSAPATLTMVGRKEGFVFEEGQSKNVTYSGDDVVTNAIIPPIGTTNEDNLKTVLDDINARPDKGNIVGYPSNVNVELPPWLESPNNLDDIIETLRDVAEASGRYFANGQTPSNFGNNFDATGITFVNGDVSLSGNGGGILVCTGRLTLHGGFDFNGLIIVTGEGGVDRSGGGGGTLQGNIVIAPYNKNNKAAGFLGPKYDISGGGNSEIRYNSSSVANGMTAVSNFVMGVAEK